MKRYSRQQIRKRIDGACLFCGENRYELLDAHRIVPGEQGGTYHGLNTVTVCSLHHRIIHSGAIVIDRKYLSSNGNHVLHYWEDGQEHWKDC